MISRIAISFTIFIVIVMCQPPKHTPDTEPSIAPQAFDVEGHRGCRGLYPENTLPAFQKALELKVNTLELDLAVSKDKQLIVSHEPFFRAGLSIDPQGRPITEEDQLNHNIYQLTADEIREYDVGTLPDPKHPDRENLKTFKPTFAEVVSRAQRHAYIFETNMPDLNIEIKRNPKFDGIYHPPVDEFVKIVLQDVADLGILKNTIIQSFDPESLRLVKAQEPRLRIALLVENLDGIESNLTTLGFKPDIYSCYFKLLTKEDIEYCHSKDIKVIPWTVNEVADMTSLIEMGVDGIISDYPDRLIPLVRS